MPASRYCKTARMTNYLLVLRKSVCEKQKRLTSFCSCSVQEYRFGGVTKTVGEEFAAELDIQLTSSSGRHVAFRWFAARARYTKKDGIWSNGVKKQ